MPRPRSHMAARAGCRIGARACVWPTIPGSRTRRGGTAMHRQVASLLSTKSPGRLAKLGNALGARGIDIATTGGAEWKHHGPVTLMIKDDWGAEPRNDLRGFADVMAD